MSADRPPVERAPAKINLTLRIVGRRADGYHLIDSLVAFAALCDEVSLTPGPRLALTVHGPTAQGAGADADNLVVRAAAALAERCHGLRVGHFSLLKRLPAAAGIGGGSSDAAAALRLLARLNRLSLSDERVLSAAAATGADVPVCLDPRPRRMTGIGDMLSDPIALPRMPIVLVNPRVATSTAAVFRAAKLAAPAGTEPDPTESALPDARIGIVEALAASGNDLEAPAMSLVPAIGDAMALMRSHDTCRLARMSGSGATVFGIFATCRTSAAAAKSLRAARPDWWIRTSMIG